MPRRLLVNGRWLAANPTGVQRYAGELARRLLALEPDARLALPADAPAPDWLDPARVERSRARGMLFEQVVLPWMARGRLLVGLAASGPLVVREQLVMMPDALTARYPRTYSRLFVAWYALMYRVLIRRARHVITISEFSRGELAEVLGVPPERFTLVFAGHEHVLGWGLEEPSAELVERASTPFVLCVGSLTPSKNLAPATRALAEAGIPVIVVGASGASRVYAAEQGLDAPGVWLAGRLSDDELTWLLRRARALVFPSLYEGFGLPVVEAQAVGCPVIASDAASIPEVAGDGALLFDPRRPAEAVALLERLDDPAERARLVAAGHANVARFSWDAAARRLAAVLSAP